MRELKPCGTEGAYKRHIARHEVPCDACRVAHAAAARDYFKRNPGKRARDYQANLEASRKKSRDSYRKHRQRYQELSRKYEQQRKHGKDVDAVFAAMWELQGGRCYLCQDPLPEKDRDTHIDHDHRCCPPDSSCPVCRRGLACAPCNAAIGYARDDPQRLRLIADNLEAALAVVSQRLNGRPEQLALDLALDNAAAAGTVEAIPVPGKRLHAVS